MTKTRGRPPKEIPKAPEIQFDEAEYRASVAETRGIAQIKASYTAERDQLNQMIHRVQMGLAQAGLSTAINLQNLKSIKESKSYRLMAGEKGVDRRGVPIPDLGTWDGFCRALGCSPDKIDEDLLNFEAFGADALERLTAVGAGYRELRQFRKLPEDRKLEVLEVAKRLVEFHLDALGQQPVASLAKTCGLDRALIQEALTRIRQLSPKPAARFDQKEVPTVIPDVTVLKDRSGRWVARLSTQALPKLQINPLYARLIREHSGENSLGQKLQEARWMVKNIEQRSDTILRVAQAIVAAQQPFFHLGAKAMKPMILKDIAESCDLHESTVSRVTTQKFMLTPLGCFELKFFFSSHVGTDDGGSASATALKAQIGEWIRQENSSKPLSDQAIADRFAESGVVVARRTVAKYRESLRIPSASLRKQT